jgi:hypothetical protein
MLLQNRSSNEPRPLQQIYKLDVYKNILLQEIPELLSDFNFMKYAHEYFV